MSISIFISRLAKLALALTLGGCVSLNFGGAKIIKSNEVKFKEPVKPFREVKTAAQDHTWRNELNGNTISYLSECNDPSDPSLEQIATGITGEIDDAQKIESSEVDFNSRPALHSIVDGKVDGIATRFELMILKKNSCIYVLTYAAVTSDFAASQKDFIAFAKGFQVP